MRSSALACHFAGYKTNIKPVTILCVDFFQSSYLMKIADLAVEANPIFILTRTIVSLKDPKGDKYKL